MSAATAGRVLEHAIVAIVTFHAIRIWRVDGTKGLLKSLTRAIRGIPGVNPLISAILRREVAGAVRLLANAESATQDATRQLYSIPEKGVPKDELLAQLDKLRETETHAEDGRLFAYVYTPNDADHESVMAQAFHKFTESPGHGDAQLADIQRVVFEGYMHGNALNPNAFPSLRTLETQVVSMVADMLNADGHAVGSMTSGGTESLLLAVKTYRDLARELRPHIKEPEMVMPITAHPALEKAAHYFGVHVVHVPLTSDFKADMKAFRNAINENTILLVASATQYCHAVIDPIPEISDLAIEFGLPLHVDACFGGFMVRI